MTPANPTRPLIPYLRQSRKKERSISIDEQRRDVERWAAANGVTLADEIVEQGVSGSKSWKERALGQAVEACQRSEAAGIIVAWQDRLSRENGLATAEVWYALRDAEARLVCANEGGEVSRLIFAIKAAVAEEQWERHRANWQKATRSAIERGKHVGPTPAGYDRVRDGEDKGRLVPSEHADAIRVAFRLRAQGSSWRRVARALTDAGVPTQSGRPWHMRGVVEMLSSRTYLGEVRWGTLSNPGAHEPLVDLATFEAVRAQRGVARAVTRGEREGALLGGLVRCGSCGSRMSIDSTTVSGRRYEFYRCRGNPACAERAAVSARRLEPWVERLALEALQDAGGPGWERSEGGPGAAELEAAVEAAEAEVAAYALHTPATTPGYAQGLAARQAAREQALVSLSGTASRTSVRFLMEPATTEVYLGMPTSRRREVLGCLVERVTVRRGRGAVEERATITYRAPYGAPEPTEFEGLPPIPGEAA